VLAASLALAVLHVINNARTREVLEKGMFEIRPKSQMNKISQCLAPKTYSAIIVVPVPVQCIHCSLAVI